MSIFMIISVFDRKYPFSIDTDRINTYIGKMDRLGIDGRCFILLSRHVYRNIEETLVR